MCEIIRTAAPHINIKQCSLCQVTEKLSILLSPVCETFKQNIGASFQSASIKINFYCKRVIVMIEGNIYIP